MPIPMLFLLLIFFFYFVYDHIVPQVSLATFAIYVLLGNELTATKTFVAISLFNILRFPLMMLPHVVTSAIQVCLGTAFWHSWDGRGSSDFCLFCLFGGGLERFGLI